MSQVSQVDIILIQTPIWLQEVFSRGQPLWPPERWRPSQPRGRQLGGRIPTRSQKVAPQTLSVGRDITAVPCLPCQPCQSLTSILVNRGVVPLKDTLQEVRAKVAGRLALFHNYWLKVTHDQWVFITVQGYRLEFLMEPVQTVSPRELQTSPLKQSLIQEEIQICCRKKP